MHSCKGDQVLRLQKRWAVRDMSHEWGLTAVRCGESHWRESVSRERREFSGG